MEYENFENQVFDALRKHFPDRAEEIIAGQLFSDVMPDMFAEKLNPEVCAAMIYDHWNNFDGVGP